MSRHARPRPAAMTALFAVSLAGAIGCGGTDSPQDTTPADTTAAPVRTDTSPAEPAPADTVPADAIGPDTTPADTTPTDTTPANTPPAAAPVDSAGQDEATSLPGWSESEWTGGSGSGRGTQVDLRTGRHDDFDRVVLVFSDRVPAYTVRYTDRPRQCGSGRPVERTAPAYVTITLDPARAHNQRGNATVQNRVVEPGLPVLSAATLFCDFEGRVEWVLGLERRVALRAFVLDSPARLVVDLRH